MNRLVSQQSIKIELVTDRNIRDWEMITMQYELETDRKIRDWERHTFGVEEVIARRCLRTMIQNVHDDVS